MADTFEGWTILELMGHRRLAGHLSEREIAGASFLRLDIPGPCKRCDGNGGLQEVDLDGHPTHTEDPCTGCDGLGAVKDATQYYSPAAVYCITPTTEDVARVVAFGNQPAPVKRWELPSPPIPEPFEYEDEKDDYNEGGGPF